MAPQPKHQIQRKLIKRFFDNNLPQTPHLSFTANKLLFECWEKKGIDHPSCTHHQDAFDNEQKIIKNFKKKIEKLEIQNIVMKTLTRPTFKFQFKGRHRKDDHIENRHNLLIPYEPEYF